MNWQLRIYRIKEGQLEAWIDEWSTQVAPLRRHFGFTVLGPWIDGATFYWVIGHDGDFAAADARYYASAERKAVDPDPARHVDAQQQLMWRVE